MDFNVTPNGCPIDVCPRLVQVRFAFDGFAVEHQQKQALVADGIRCPYGFRCTFFAQLDHHHIDKVTGIL